MEVHSMETRINVIRACEEGELTQEEIAEQFGVSSRWVRWLYRRWLDTGRVEPLPHGGGFPVSYTHLDVYKRQGQVNSQFTWEPSKRPRGNPASHQSGLLKNR